MKIDYYVINLDRSTDRLAAMQAEADALGVDLIRIPAIEGKTVPEAERRDFDEAGFRRLHGKRPMPGEYGCYASHLIALDRIAASDADAAIVFEDDVVPKPGFLAILTQIAATDDWDVVKLAHHRSPMVRTVRHVGGHRLGHPVFGPTGSSAAYLVRRSAAARLRAGLTPMRLPFDVALERGWALDLRFLHAVPDLVLFHPDTKTSLTLDGQSYASRKLPPWRRLTTLGFRTFELFRRLRYAVGARS